MTAVGVDAIGSGVSFPVSVLSFRRTTSISVDRVGLVVSLAAVLDLPVALLVGHGVALLLAHVLPVSAGAGG